MPQLIAGFIVVVAAIYAVIYLVAILFYGLTTGLPAAAVMWGTAFVCSVVLAQRVPQAISFSVDLVSDRPRLFRTERRRVGKEDAIISSLVGLAVAALALFFLGKNVTGKGGTDPEWVRIAGVATGWVILAGSAIFVHRSLAGKREETACTELFGLGSHVEYHEEQLQRTIDAAKRLGVAFESPGWDFLQTAISGAAPEDFEDVATRLIERQTSMHEAAAVQYQEMSYEMEEAQKLLKIASEKAVALSSPTLLQLVDEVSKQFQSPVFIQILAARDIAQFRRVLTDARQKLQGVAAFRGDANEGEGANRNPKAESAEPQSQVLRTVQDALKFLGLADDVDQQTVRTRLFRLSSFYHPDKAKDLLDDERRGYEEKMKVINNARDILSAAGRG